MKSPIKENFDIEKAQAGVGTVETKGGMPVKIISYNAQTDKNCNVFACSKQAKSALAMARISQIMANDDYYGFPITDEEWKNDAMWKYCITRYQDHIDCNESTFSYYNLLAFRTREQRDAFMADYPQLVRDYLMLE